MQIGAFAKLCETKISVLRHYDREGLLVPDAEMEPYRRPIASMQIDGKPSYQIASAFGGDTVRTSFPYHYHTGDAV